MGNHDTDYSQYYEVHMNMKLVTGVNIIIFAFSYHLSLFPTYNSLGENKSSKTGMQAVLIGTSFTFVIYLILGTISIYIFGSELHESVMENVDEEVNVYSYIIRVAFLIVLACHIPYMFFPTKEGFLILVDEIRN